MISVVVRENIWPDCSLCSRKACLHCLAQKYLKEVWTCSLSVKHRHIEQKISFCSRHHHIFSAIELSECELAVWHAALSINNLIVRPLIYDFISLTICSYIGIHWHSNFSPKQSMLVLHAQVFHFIYRKWKDSRKLCYLTVMSGLCK